MIIALEVESWWVKVPRILPKMAVLATLFAIQSPGADPVKGPPPPEPDSLVFVYVHGFGGVKESPEFYENLNGFLADAEVPSKVINYEWDSEKVDVLHAGSSWLKAQENADAEAAVFKREVIDSLELAGRPYVLVGFSVGSRVLLKGIEACEAPLEHLHGIYFLGSAMTKDTTLKNRDVLPEGLKIVNYHSPTRDLVHQLAFNFMSDVPPGGQEGFDDEEVFENYAVSCAHAHKGIGVATDYSGLAEAIAYLELHDQGVEIAGRTKLNWEMDVMEGDLWWNKLRRVGDVEYQQHTARRDYYRAIRIEKNGERKRVARGDNLHAVMAAAEGA